MVPPLRRRKDATEPTPMPFTPDRVADAFTTTTGDIQRTAADIAACIRHACTPGWAVTHNDLIRVRRILRLLVADGRAHRVGTKPAEPGQSRPTGRQPMLWARGRG